MTRNRESARHLATGGVVARDGIVSAVATVSLEF